MIPPPTDRALPAGFRAVLGSDVRVLDEGRSLLGGSPLRLMRLDPRAAAVVGDWQRNRWSEDATSRAVARRLLDAGIAHPRPGSGGPTAEEVTVVVPVRDRPDALARCLAAIRRCAEVIVVDDGSACPGGTEKVAAATGARVVRREVNGGPAAARNTGLAHCTTPYVAFVDSDCRPVPGWLEHLLPHLRDPAVAIVAPRIIPCAEADGWLGSYEQARSSLDLGIAEAPVVPCSRVSYVPSATLLARRTVIASGFNEAFLVGEDVDLVWRTWEAGWTIRYEPSAVVRHDHRPRLRDWAGRRYLYGTTAAPLALAHAGQVPPVAMSRWTLATWALASAGRPRLAMVLTGVAAGLLVRRLPLHQRRVSESARLVAVGTMLAGEQLARAVTRTWWPLALPAALVSRRAQVAVGVAVLGPPVLDWLRTDRQIDLGRFTAAHLVDDLSYGAGVWRGCLRHRTVAPLLPKLVRFPPPRP
jgi:mycofactocin system glycosyltransferase